MTKDDVLFGYRQQLFAEAARTSVSAACRTFGVHRSTYYAWKRQVDRHGLEMLRPRERRRPQMPNQLPKIVEERIVAFSLGHPGLGPRRVASGARPGRSGAGSSSLPEWCVEGSLPSRAEHPHQAPRSDRRGTPRRTSHPAIPHGAAH